MRNSVDSDRSYTSGDILYLLHNIFYMLLWIWSTGRQKNSKLYTLLSVMGRQRVTSQQSHNVSQADSKISKDPHCHTKKMQHNFQQRLWHLHTAFKRCQKPPICAVHFLRSLNIKQTCIDTTVDSRWAIKECVLGSSLIVQLTYSLN